MLSATVRPICIEESTSPELFNWPKRLSGYRYFSPFGLSSVTYNLTSSDICVDLCQKTAPTSSLSQLENHGPPCTSSEKKNDPRNRFLVGASLATWHSGRWYLLGIVTKSYGCHERFSHFVSVVGGSDRSLNWINSYKNNDDRNIYMCLDGQSVSINKLCDGYVDCFNDGGSDEDFAFCEAWLCKANALDRNRCAINLHGNAKY